MAGGNRPERVAALIREEIAELLSRGVMKDPRIKMASISSVKLSTDLKSAKVYVQVIGTQKERNETIVGMQSAVGFIRKELRERLSLRQVPELRFIADDSAEKADNVLGILGQISRERDAKALAEGGATEKPAAGDDEAEDDEAEEDSDDGDDE